MDMKYNNYVDDAKYQRRINSKFHRILAQVISTTAFGCLILSVSAICAMPTVILNSNSRKDIRNGTNITLSDNNDTSIEVEFSGSQSAWFGGVVFLVQPLGSVTSGFIQDKFGRKKCMMAVTIPQLAGWIILHFSQSVSVMFLAAIIMGLSIGFMEAPAMSFLGEVTEPKYRGIMGTFSEVFLLLGISIEFILAATIYWRTACLISALIPILALAVIGIVPESPVWLLTKGRYRDAENALCWLRGWVHPDIVRQEYADLIEYLGVGCNPDYIPLKGAPKGAARNQKESPLAQVKRLFKSRVYKPLFLVISYFFVCHCITLLGMRPKIKQVLQDYEMPLSEKNAMVAMGAFLLGGSITGSCTIRKFGKRGLTMFSVGCCTICCLLLSAYTQSPVEGYSWIPLSLFSIIYFFSGLAVMPIPWILCCEVFPMDTRGIAAGLAAASSYLFSGLIATSYSILSETMTVQGVLLAYGLVGVAGFVYMYYCLPETEGKTLQEVELYFNPSLRDSNSTWTPEQKVAIKES